MTPFGGGHSVYFPHFGDQLVADLGQLLDLSVLKGARVTGQLWKNQKDGRKVVGLLPSAGEPVPESRSSSAPSSSWPSAPCRLSWLSHAPARSPHWPCGTCTSHLSRALNWVFSISVFLPVHISSRPTPALRTCPVSPQRGLSASGTAAPPA